MNTTPKLNLFQKIDIFINKNDINKNINTKERPLFSWMALNSKIHQNKTVVKTRIWFKPVLQGIGFFKMLKERVERMFLSSLPKYRLLVNFQKTIDTRQELLQDSFICKAVSKKINFVINRRLSFDFVKNAIQLKAVNKSIRF